MSRFHSYISSASKIITTYSPGKPLSTHIKDFFSKDKKFGSRDRRTISSLCYYYFRTGKAFRQQSIEEKMFCGLFLCENKRNELLDHFRKDLNDNITLAVNEKLAILNVNETDIFPFEDDLSDHINKEYFSLSFLKQPAIYLRIRPGRKKITEDKLNSAVLKFELLNDECIKLENNVAADKILKLNKDAVVQDINSQKVLDYLNETQPFLSVNQKVPSWDCCAASGGKSILLFDRLKGNIQLTVSDIRENILLNLRKRLMEAGINLNKSFVSDLSVEAQLPVEEKFSIIICDAPCTGSGTWSRTPEQLFSFNKKMIVEYSDRQKKIVSNTIPHLKEGGLFFYITCSVFKKENEEVVSFIKEKFHLELAQMEYLKGYESTADTMFVAVFTSIKA